MHNHHLSCCHSQGGFLPERSLRLLDAEAAVHACAPLLSLSFSAANETHISKRPMLNSLRRAKPRWWRHAKATTNLRGVVRQINPAPPPRQSGGCGCIALSNKARTP